MILGADRVKKLLVDNGMQCTVVRTRDLLGWLRLGWLQMAVNYLSMTQITLT